MSVHAISWALRQPTGHPSDKALLLVLANYADEDGVCWPSQERLVQESGFSARTIVRALQRLEARGLICRRKRGGDGTGRRTDIVTLATCHNGNLPQWQPATVSELPATVSELPATVAPKPSLEPPIEPLEAAEPARARDLEKRLHEAVGETVNPVSPQIMILAEPLNWLDGQGCDLDADVLPVLKAQAAKRERHAIRSWSYFREAVLEARDRRLKPMIEPRARGSPAQRRESNMDQNMRAIHRVFGGHDDTNVTVIDVTPAKRAGGG